MHGTAFLRIVNCVGQHSSQHTSFSSKYHNLDNNVSFPINIILIYTHKTINLEIKLYKYCDILKYLLSLLQ